MNETFSNKDGIQIIYSMIDAIQENKQYLSDIDGAIGDGDHGINMNKGFTKCKDNLQPDDTLATGLGKLAKALMGVGGSMGPLYGFFFKSMGSDINDVEFIDRQAFASMLNAAKASLAKISDARPGDKTLMDAFLPAVDAFVSTETSFAEALDAMTKAAASGRDFTKDLVAKKGRSSRMGERSRGVIDAGAASCTLLLQAMADSVKNLIA